MNEETFRFVAQTLWQVELLVLGILRGLSSLPLETRSVRLILSHNEEDGVGVEIFTSELGRVHSFSHPCSGEMQWKQIILARVESVLEVGGRWTNPVGNIENEDLVLSLSRADSTSATCLSEADVEAIDAHDRTSMGGSEAHPKEIGGDRSMHGGSFRRV